MDTQFPLAAMKSSETPRWWWQLHSAANVLEATAWSSLTRLKRWILCYARRTTIGKETPHCVL